MTVWIPRMELDHGFGMSSFHVHDFYRLPMLACSTADVELGKITRACC